MIMTMLMVMSMTMMRMMRRLSTQLFEAHWGGVYDAVPPLGRVNPPAIRPRILIAIPALKNEVFARDVLKIWRVPLASFSLCPAKAR